MVRRVGGAPQVLLVHRPKYDDWSLPKGKLEPGESFKEAAVREVEEEAGVRCGLDRELGQANYQDAKGRPKLVRYWMMWPAAGIAQPYAEIDDVRWATQAEAAAMLSYDRDRAVLASLPGISPRTN